MVRYPATWFSSTSTTNRLEKYKGKLKGAILMTRAPSDVPSDTDIPNNAYDAVIPPNRGVPRAGAQGRFRQRQQLMKTASDEGAAAVLLDSGKTDSLFNMTGLSRYEPSQLPTAFLTHEDYWLIYRLLQNGPVAMSMNLTGTFSPGPAKASITVAEIKGSEHPDERVIIGGHLDSWDLGQGAARQRHRSHGDARSRARVEDSGVEAQTHDHIHSLYWRRSREAWAPRRL